MSSAASLTLATVRLSAAVRFENAWLLPSVALMSGVLPCTPVLWSQPRSVKVAGPPSRPSGLKRSKSVAPSSSALVLASAGVLSQLVPASMEYCHSPVPGPLLPTNATPLTAPRSTSL